MVDVQPKTSRQNKYSKYQRMALCVWFPCSIRHVDTGQTSSSVSQRRITSLSWQSYDINFFGLERTTHRYHQLISTLWNELPRLQLPTSKNDLVYRVNDFYCFPSDHRRVSSTGCHPNPPVPVPAQQCVITRCQDIAMTTKFQFHNTNWPWLLTGHTGLCEGCKGTCILKVNFHYRIFHPGNLPVMLGVENPTGRMIAMAWPYSWRLSLFHMQSCVSSFWLIQPCQFVNLTLSSHDSSWLNQFWLKARMFIN